MTAASNRVSAKWMLAVGAFVVAVVGLPTGVAVAAEPEGATFLDDGPLTVKLGADASSASADVAVVNASLERTDLTVVATGLPPPGEDVPVVNLAECSDMRADATESTAPPPSSSPAEPLAESRQTTIGVLCQWPRRSPHWWPRKVPTPETTSGHR